MEKRMDSFNFSALNLSIIGQLELTRSLKRMITKQ